MVDEAAPAKINLTLRVTGRRGDGYHLLDSLVVFAGAADMLRAEPASGLGLRVTGPFGTALSGETENLVTRAARALAEAHGLRPDVALTLEKTLPVASGIGGGSADAAAALRLLSRLWGVRIPQGLALRLGADVPVCLARSACRMRGVGEVLSTPPALPACGLVLVNPGVALATKDVFAARVNGFAAEDRYPASWRGAADLAAWLDGSANDLEAPALTLCPAVGAVLSALRTAPDVLLARMSGSGATCFALSPSAEAAARAAARLARPGWWCWGGGLWAG